MEVGALRCESFGWSTAMAPDGLRSAHRWESRWRGRGEAEGSTLTGVETQSANIARDCRTAASPDPPLPFLYESTGAETRFTNRLDPEPRSRGVFAFHRPETLAEWTGSTRRRPSDAGRRRAAGEAHDAAPTLRARLREMPPIERDKLWPPRSPPIETWKDRWRRTGRAP